MGNADTKLNFRKSVVKLTTRTQPVDASDEVFWSQFWSESATCVQDVFTLIPAAEIRALREETPSNLATLCYKSVEKLVQIAETGCRSVKDEQIVQNCIRLLTRILPYIFEDPDWRGFFWSTLPGQKKEKSNEDDSVPLAQSLLNALCDLLFCPDFTVSPNKKSGPDDMTTIDSCEYIWAAGVGFTHNSPSTATIDQNRTEILKFLLTCFSETMYLPSIANAHLLVNQWTSFFTSTENRHALPLFTSLLNIVCSYDPVGYGLPYNHLMFSNSREPLVEVALQVLCVTLDCKSIGNQLAPSDSASNSGQQSIDLHFGGSENLFVNYLSRIHREEDFAYMLKGITRLLNNPLMQTYLPGSCKKIQFHQELLVFLWKICDINKKFMYYVLKSSDVLDILIPILFYLNDARSDQSRVGLMHIGVFILLLLSGERNFGVRLNKPYSARIPMDIPIFTGTHADLLIIVFHKIITSGHQKLQPLFDCLLTIIVNISPYLKTLSMVASTKLLHLLEAFSTPWFLFANPANHHLMFFLLEVYNNIIQYQFDGNANLVYTIIRKRAIFHQLASLPSDHVSIGRALAKSNKNIGRSNSQEASILTEGPSSVSEELPTMEGSQPATEAEPGTLQVSLAATPGIDKMTEKAQALTLQTDQVETNPNLSPPHDLLMPPQFFNNLIAPSANEIKLSDNSAFTPVVSGAAKEESSSLSSERSHLENHMNIDDKQIINNLNDVGQRDDNEIPDGVPISLNAVSRETQGARKKSVNSPPISPVDSNISRHSISHFPERLVKHRKSLGSANWVPTPDWVQSWKQKLPLQTIMRLLQVLVPQVEKICIDKGLTDESEILKFLQHGTLVGLLPVPHPILIRKYQPNSGTTMWFRTYMWGIIYLRNIDPPIWYDTDVKLFEIQRV